MACYDEVAMVSIGAKVGSFPFIVVMGEVKDYGGDHKAWQSPHHGKVPSKTLVRPWL